jgi:dTDP-4-amino-4,6-dideoxygalactose transaminase
MDLARQHAPLAGDLRAAFDRVLESSGFILGEEVERFELEFAGYCDVEHCVGVASGTAALTIMLEAAGIGRGDEVIVPAHTFIASALAVVHAGATPVYVDVERGTGLIDPTLIEAAIGPSTAAILVVHLYGQACAMDPLQELADRHGLPLLEDAAQAHGATYRGKRAGGLGRAAAFSFYPSKNLGALGDGGAICTNDGALAARARQLRDLGRGDSPEHVVAGYNERLDGLQAALLRAKLPYLDEWNAARRRVADRYRALLQGVELLKESADSPCIYHLFPVRVADRDALAAELRSCGIATGVHYSPSVPEQHPLCQPEASRLWPASGEWAASELSLPIFPVMTDAQITLVADRVNGWSSGQPEESFGPEETGHVNAGVSAAMG